MHVCTCVGSYLRLFLSVCLTAWQPDCLSVHMYACVYVTTMSVSLSYFFLSILQYFFLYFFLSFLPSSFFLSLSFSSSFFLSFVCLIVHLFIRSIYLSFFLSMSCIYSFPIITTFLFLTFQPSNNNFYLCFFLSPPSFPSPSHHQFPPGSFFLLWTSHVLQTTFISF